MKKLLLSLVLLAKMVPTLQNYFCKKARYSAALNAGALYLIWLVTIA
jgi:hypothetical protein